jgi:hypothetical protein
MTKGISMLTGKGFRLDEEESINSPVWYLQLNGSEHGPLKFGELIALLSARRLQGALYFWRPGLMSWVPIQALPQDSTPASVLVQNEIANYERNRKRRENSTAYALSMGEAQPRRSARHGFVASVFTLSPEGRRQYLGVCTDLSARGLGIKLEEGQEVSVGQSLSLEVVPISVSGLKAFRVKGKVRWSTSGLMGLELSNYAAAERALAEFC